MSNTLQLFANTAYVLPGVLTIIQTEIPNELKQYGEKKNTYFIGASCHEICVTLFCQFMFLNSKSSLKVISHYLSNSECIFISEGKCNLNTRPL